MTTCRRCNQPIELNSPLCPHCGALQQDRRPMNPAWRIVVWFVVIVGLLMVLLVLGAFAACFYFMSKGTH